MTFVYVIGAFIGFVGNRKWTFAHRGDSSSAALRYVLAHLFGYLLNFLILFAFVDHLGYAHQWVQAVAIYSRRGIFYLSYLNILFFRENFAKKKYEYRIQGTLL